MEVIIIRYATFDAGAAQIDRDVGDVFCLGIIDSVDITSIFKSKT